MQGKCSDFNYDADDCDGDEDGDDNYDDHDDDDYDNGTHRSVSMPSLTMTAVAWLEFGTGNYLQASPIIITTTAVMMMTLHW